MLQLLLAHLYTSTCTIITLIRVLGLAPGMHCWVEVAAALLLLLQGSLGAAAVLACMKPFRVSSTFVG
jgi:hypothetical protein